MAVRTLPAARLRVVNDAPVRRDGAFVLYWMIAARRRRGNFALERAVELARELGKPLLVLEPLRVDYPHASERLHRFVIDGMRDNARAFAKSDVRYYPWVEKRPGEGRGLLAALAARACAVVTDEFPSFFLPAIVEAAAEVVPVRMEAVDANGLLPLRLAEKTFLRAHDFRRFLHRELPRYPARAPKRDPLARVSLPPLRRLPAGIAKRWPAASARLLDGRGSLHDLPLDHSVAPVDRRGGAEAGGKLARRFVEHGLDRYFIERNQTDATSGLSPYLHFGHISTHEILDRVAKREAWTIEHVHPERIGRREGWWGMSEAAEAFLDQLVTWRELAYHFAARRADHAEYDSLPAWALRTLEEHAGDPRPYLYDREQFEHAATHDALWNAIQRQLVEDGRIENYLRMLWGKKILHWSRSPREAHEIMVALNDRYALDGRDPNSYAGIGWVLGRFDRPWGPEREVFGRIRFMRVASTRRKLKLDSYLARWGPRR